MGLERAAVLRAAPAHTVHYERRRPEETILHCLVLDGVYRRTEGEPVFQEARAPSREELQGLLDNIIARLLKVLTRLGTLVQEEGMTYLADRDPDNPLTPLQAASCTYRIALGPRAGQKVLSLRTVAGRAEPRTQALCAESQGFSLHAGARCGAHQRKELERLCRYITRPAIANERLKRDGAPTRMAVRVRRNRSGRGAAETDKPAQAGSFHQTPPKLTASRPGDTAIQSRMEKKVV